MKKLMFLLLLIFILFSVTEIFAQSCSTIGAKDCRVTNPGSCHWWVCDGKSKQWIFTGQSCTCPSRRSNLDSEFPGFVLAQYQHICRDQANLETIKAAAKKCVPEARTQDPQFTAFINPDTCNFNINGGFNQEAFWAADRVFKACMKENGISMSHTPNR